MNSNKVLAQHDAQMNWSRARRAAGFETILNLLRRQSDDLLSFEHVQKKLHLSQKNYRGLQEIPLKQIRGSVGRYQDFTQTFLPKRDWMRDRWQHISTVATTKGLDPIEVYQVGEAYFVLDGNHRVSVGLQNGMNTIQAHVWEFPTIAGLSPEADINDLIIKSEYVSFLQNTNLDKLRPDQEIIFTAPGRYREIEYQIEWYRGALEEIDGEAVSYEQAVEAWFDMIYTPAVAIIKERNMLANFPDRTEADLFIWVWKHRDRLAGEGGDQRLDHIIDDLTYRNPRVRLKNLWQSLTGWLRRK